MMLVSIFNFQSEIIFWITVVKVQYKSYRTYWNDLTLEWKQGPLWVWKPNTFLFEQDFMENFFVFTSWLLKKPKSLHITSTIVIYCYFLILLFLSLIFLI